MRIVITGGSGFLGTEIVKQLRAEGHEVFSLQRNHSDYLASLGINQILCDLSKKDKLFEALSELKAIDAVFHTAAKAGIWGSFASYFLANVVATQNILEWSKKHKIKYFVYTSTPSVIYSKNSLENADESTPYPNTFLTFYARTKAQAEVFVLSAQSPDLQVISLRPHLVFGPGDPHLVPRIVSRALKNRLIQVGRGQNLVDVIHVTNAAYAHICALNYLLEDMSNGGKAYFIGQERPVPLWWFIGKILEFKNLPPIRHQISLGFAYNLGLIMEGVYKLLPCIGEPQMTRFLAMQLGTSHYFNQSAAICDLGYRPKVTIEDGLHSI